MPIKYAKIDCYLKIIKHTSTNLKELKLYRVGFKKYILLIYFQREGRKKEKHRSGASCTCPNQGPARNPRMCPDQELNWRPFTLQNNARATELHWSGLTQNFCICNHNSFNSLVIFAGEASLIRLCCQEFTKLIKCQEYSFVPPVLWKSYNTEFIYSVAYLEEFAYMSNLVFWWIWSFLRRLFSTTDSFVCLFLTVTVLLRATFSF